MEGNWRKEARNSKKTKQNKTKGGSGAEEGEGLQLLWGS